MDEGGSKPKDLDTYKGRFAQRCRHKGSLGGDGHANTEAETGQVQLTSPGMPGFARSHLRLQEAMRNLP